MTDGVAAGALFAFLVMGPVLLRALRRLAWICLNDVIEKWPLSQLASLRYLRLLCEAADHL
jgi:hypothetical protein